MSYLRCTQMCPQFLPNTLGPCTVDFEGNKDSVQYRVK